MVFESLVHFLHELSHNNNKTWFEANRAEYQSLRLEFLVLVEDMIRMVGQVDPLVQYVDAKDCLFRINRDLRFSKDKRPYKTTFSADISDKGRSNGWPSYYFQIDEGGTILQAAGVYMPESRSLKTIRNYIVTYPERLQAVIEEPGFKRKFRQIEGRRLVRPPGGFDADTPLIDQVKLTSFTLSREYKASTFRSTNEFLKRMVNGYESMYPLVNWLRDALASG